MKTCIEPFLAWSLKGRDLDSSLCLQGLAPQYQLCDDRQVTVFPSFHFFICIVGVRIITLEPWDCYITRGNEDKALRPEPGT